MQRRSSRLGISAAAVGALLLFTACGSEDTQADPPAAAGARLAVVKDAKLGEIVVDAKGPVLYRFDNDTNQPAKSNCSSECLASWPAATTSGKPNVYGVDAALVGTAKRDDGTGQITLAGWPLYRFAADTKAGEAKGHGVGGIWWTVTPNGDKAAAAEKPAGY
jgi:predicted lipoprotein with Yx(FWY)xxD motif